LNNLQEKLAQGKFVFTVELGPPKGIDIKPLLEQATTLNSLVDAINLTDNQRAVMRMSSFVAGFHLLAAGITPICQLTCRDRNRLALQSELLGAASMGVENVLILTGDHTLIGNYPEAKPVFDLDSVQLLATAQTLMAGESLAGNQLQGKPNFFLGGVVNPCPETLIPQVWKLKRKVQAGLQFVQTQAVYNVSELKAFKEAIPDLDIYILAGIIPLKSAKMAYYMNEFIPGITVPDNYIRIMEKSPEPMKDGLKIAQEVIEEIKEAKVCNGIHLMPLGIKAPLEPWLEAVIR
jgi:methylenetetrahydrofolate reductase (NADPH)